MRKIIAGILCVLAIVAFSSCSDAPESATLRIEMDRKIRTVTPEKENMEVYGYRIILIGPDSKEAEPRYTYYSYINLDGLTVGRWKIKVFGFNKERVDVCQGEKDLDLTAGKNSVTVKLDQLIGKGSFTLAMVWDTESFPDAEAVSVSLKAQDGTEIAVTPSKPTVGKSIVTKDNLDTGSYSFSAKLLDSKGNILSGATEAIRISNKEETKGEIVFPSSTKDSTGDTRLEISNDTSIPVEVMINGIESLMEENAPFTLNVSLPSSSPLSLNDLDTTWYLDGEEVGRGNEFTFQNGVKSGIHRIDVTCQTSSKGSLGSTHVIFQAAVSTNQGDPYQKYTLENGEKWKLGAGVVAHFLPDETLIIVSNQYRTVQLVSTEGARPEMVKEFSFDALGLDGKVVDFATCGDEDEGYWPVIFLVNKDYSCKAVKVIASEDEMSKTDEAQDFDRNGGELKADKFVNIVASDGLFIATMENNDRSRMGIVLFNPYSTKGKMVYRDDWFPRDPYFSWGRSGFRCSSSIRGNGYTVIASGERSMLYKFTRNAEGNYSIREYMMWTSYDDYMSYYNAGKCKAEFNGAKSCGFLTKDASYAFVFAKDGIYYFKDTVAAMEEYSIYHKESLDGSNIGDLKMSPDTEFCYALDNESHRLYTMRSVMDSSKGGFVLEKGSWIDYGSRNADCLEISLSGETLAVFDKTDSTYLTLIRAAR